MLVEASTSDSNFISTYHLVNFPLDELDVYLGTDDLGTDDLGTDELDVYLGPKETASNELISTEQNVPTDTSTPLQGISCGKTSVNFSQSSPPPVAIVNPQQKAQTEAESDNPLLTSSKGKAARARSQAKYNQSPAGKAARARSQAKYNQSPAGKAARARAKAKYIQSPAGKAAIARYKAVQSARKHAYEIELATSGNKEIAKQKGEEAAAEKKKIITVRPW